MELASPARLDEAAFQALFDRCSNWGRWGPDDERGTLNLITPEHRVRAAGLVREGHTVSCAWPINTVGDAENLMPAVHLMLRAGDVVTAEQRGTADYLAIAPHGVTHSHLDALCHVSWRYKMYNGRPITEVTSAGARANAITINQDGIVTRGVLLDVPRSKGLEWLEPGYAITPADLEAAEAAAGVRVGEGDVLLVRTGRHRKVQVDGPWNSRAVLAGLHHECGPWLRERDVALLGSDGISDVRPHAFGDLPLPMHTLTIVAMGMQLLDNQNLEDLAAACAERGRWAFMLVIAPLRIVGGTGSATNPIAIF